MAGGASDSDDAIVGINVTPLVDIVLVLLIIFMVTARIIVSQSVPMDLPKAASGSDVQVVFSAVLGADGKLLVDSTPVADDDAIFPLAREAHSKNPEVRAVIKADSAIPHGRVIHILDLMKQAGIAKIAFGVSPTAPQPGAALPKAPAAAPK